MSERRVEDCPIKFGPMWLRNFSREGIAGASGGSGGSGSSGSGPNRNQPPPPGPNRPSQPPSKYKLAQHRYGREEMLALYEPNLEAPPGLVAVEALYVPHAQRPIALTTDTSEEEPRDNIRNSLGLNRNIVPGGVGAGLQPIERFGMGRGLADLSRGRGRHHQPFNGRSGGYGRDDLYGDTPAPGLTRSWSSGPHPTPRNGDGSDWNQNRPTFRRWPEPNWRRPNSTGRPFGEDGDGLRRLQPLGRPRQPLDKRDQKSERPISWTSSRRPWSGEQASEEHLPEWATESNMESTGGTFDSSGAFHGVDSPVQRSNAEPFFGLSRSQTQGSITRSRSHDEESPSAQDPQQTWWNANKSTGATPKKFDATKIKFKKPPLTTEDASGAEREDIAESQHDQPAAGTLNLKLDTAAAADKKMKKKCVSFSDERLGGDERFGLSKTFDALMRLNIEAEEASDERGNFNSVLITPNNALRQRHQNVMQPLSQMQSQSQMQPPGQLQQQAQPQPQVDAPPPGQPQPPGQLPAAPSDHAQPARDINVNESVLMEEVRAHQQGAGTGPRPRSLDPLAGFPSFGLPTTSMEGKTSGQGVFQSIPNQNHLNSNDPSFRADQHALLKNAALKIVQESNTWYYEDPQSNIQGPFTPSEMYQWYRAGFFSSDLMIRRACDKHMRPLGSFGDLPPFAESYSELLAFLTREAIIMDGSDQLGPDALPTPEQIQHQRMRQRLQQAQSPNTLQQTAQAAVNIAPTVQQMVRAQVPLQMMLQQPQMHSAPMQPSQLQQTPIHQAPMQQAVVQQTHLHAAPLQQPQILQSSIQQPQLQSTQLQSTNLPSTQMQSTQLQSTQLQSQQVAGLMPRTFDDMLMNSSFTTSQLQDLGSQTNSILQRQPNFGLDPILASNVPTTTQPGGIQYGNGSNNNFLMDQIVQPQMVESLWGQSSQNFGWMQPAPVISRPEAPWEARASAVPPELAMAEPKSKQPEGVRAESQPGLPARLVLASLMSQPPPPVGQPVSVEVLEASMRAAALQAAIAEDAKDISVADNVAKPVDDLLIQKTPEPPIVTPKVAKVASPIQEVKEEPKQIPTMKAEDQVAKMDVPISSPQAPSSQPPPETKPSKATNGTPTSTAPATNDKPTKTKDNNTAKAKSKTNKNKEKDDTVDKKKKESSKNEMKIEEVPGFVKVKKEDKKKDSEKEKRDIIKEIPAATKASQRANLEKRKTEEAKAVEEAEKKRKEELKGLAAAGEQNNEYCDLLNALKVKYKETEGQLEKSRQSHAGGAAKKAPWCASNPTGPATNSEGLTLAEIQRLEREKKFESIKEQQQMVQLIAQQQQAALAREQEIMQTGYNWTKYKPTKNNNNENVQTLAEIQEETRRRQLQAALEEAADTLCAAPAPAAPAAPAAAAHAPWASNNTGPSNTSSSYLGGFWEAMPGGASKSEDNLLSPSKSRAEVPLPKEPRRKTKASSSPTNELTVSSSKSALPASEFDSWCAHVLAPHAANIDVPIFVSFLKDIESPYEVKDYVKCYLGETKDSTDFARCFLEKRSKLLRNATAAPVDDLCSPAPAKNPTSLSNSDYQEVKGKSKKVKKNKMLKIDARILGFSVTAAEDRINVGDIDSV